MYLRRDQVVGRHDGIASAQGADDGAVASEIAVGWGCGRSVVYHASRRLTVAAHTTLYNNRTEKVHFLSK